MPDDSNQLEAEPTQTQSPPGQPPSGEHEAEPEGTVELKGQKLVPLESLTAERKLSKEAKQRAERLQEVEGYVQQIRPYVDFLSAHPEFMRPGGIQQTPAEKASPQPEVDAAAMELARTLDLYDAEGKPDGARAAKLQKIINASAETIADARVGPITAQTARDQASRNYQAAMTWERDGLKPTAQTVHALFSTLSPELAADQRVAYAAWLMALGQDTLDGKAKATATGPDREPVQTETPGGRTFRRAPMTELEHAVAGLRGMNEKQYQETTKGFKDTGPSVLEDE